MSTDPQPDPPVVTGPAITQAGLAEALDSFWLFADCGGQQVHGQVADPDEVASVLLATLGRIAAERSSGETASPVAAALDPEDETRRLMAVAAGGAREVRRAIAEAVSAERERAEAAEARLLEYENAITWNTSCTSCARVLDSSIAEHERAERAEAKLAELENAVTELAPAPLTPAQCDRLRQMVTEHQEAVSAVRGALEYAAERIPTLKGAEIIDAAREALKVLSGEEGGGARPEQALPVAAAFDPAVLREQIETALDASIDRCARCKTCDNQVDAVMAVVWPLLEHAQAALTDNEGVRLWMLDCGELVAKHRERAEAAEGKLAEVSAFWLVTDEDGDIILNAPCADALGCLWSSRASRERVALGELIAAAGTHTGIAAGEMHARLAVSTGETEEGPPNNGNPVIHSGAVAPGGWVCAVPVPGNPDHICGMPVESEPCTEHGETVKDGNDEKGIQ